MPLLMAISTISCDSFSPLWLNFAFIMGVSQINQHLSSHYKLYFVVFPTTQILYQSIRDASSFYTTLNVKENYSPINSSKTMGDNIQHCHITCVLA